MKKYIAVLLLLVSVSSLLASATFSSGSASLVTGLTPETRVITQAEFEGTEDISIKINQSLIIPLHYQRHSLSNDIGLFFGAADTSVMNVTNGEPNWSNQGMVLDMNLICTGTHVGQTTVDLGEDGQIIKEFTIQVVE